MQRPGRRIEVSVSNQRLRLFEGDDLVMEFPVSTSKFGLGTEEGSNRTPLGKFRIAEKLGAGEPVRTCFVSREPAGVWDPSDPTDEDLVLSRILWLEGLEEHNANTRGRYIYIHGTNQEHLIGQPASHGCVRMKNADVEQLFNEVEPGIEVEIVP